MANVRPKAKAKRKKRQAEIAELIEPRNQRKLAREADNYLIDLEERAQARYEWAKRLKDLQSPEVQVGINRLIAEMARMAGEPRFNYKGMNLNVDGGIARLKKIQFHNHSWIALRLFVAAAEWGIRIGDFKAPKGECVRCGKKTPRR